MDPHHESTETKCPVCPECPGHTCPEPEQAEGSKLSGWRLCLAAIGCFLGPITLAILGAVYAGSSAEAQLTGALVGLGIGVVCAVGLAKLLGWGDNAWNRATRKE